MPDGSYESQRTSLETRPPNIVANILICIIHQTNYLLNQQFRVEARLAPSPPAPRPEGEGRIWLKRNADVYAQVG